MSKRDLNRQNSIIEHCDFSFENSKMYITATILMFHIFPLLLKALGEAGNALLDNLVMLVINPVSISVILLIHGIKQGFNMKMTLLCILLATASVPMYHNIAINIEMGLLYHYLVSTTISLILYTIFAFVSIWLGAFIKKRIF